MDSLTQIVLGAAVGEAVLGKKVGSRAMLWGAVAGTIPDLDVLVRLFTDDITATAMHRGISHSLFFAIAMAPILGWLVNKIHRKRDIGVKPWAWLFFWSLVTHPLLDMHTNWGTQFFWPFNYRIAYNNIFVADPVYTVPFLIFTLIALFMKRTNPKRAKINRIGLIVSSSYMFLTILFKWVSFNSFEKQLEKDKIEYVNLDTNPAPLNAILWCANVETKNGFRLGYYSFFDSEPIQFSDEIPKNHHLIRPYLKQKKIQQLIQISAGNYIVEEISPDTLHFIDVRFGQMSFDPNDRAFMWRYELTPVSKNRVKVKRVSRSPKDMNMGKLFNDLWVRMWGN